MTNIETVRTFLEIAATGNFNRAAKHLNVTQSTVSARIKTLETHLDRKLFSRGHNGVELTAAGQYFHRHAATLVRAWEQGRQQIALPEGFSTAFGVGAQVSLWERLVSRWIPWMRAKAPSVALHLETDYSESLMRQLADGLMDAAVMYSPRAAPGLITEKLLEERLVLVSTTRRTLTSDWRDDYVFVDWGYDFQTEHSKAFPEMEAAAIRVGLGAMGLQYILDNGGSGYFPLRVVRPLLAQKRLYRVPRAPSFGRPAYMVYPASPSDPELLSMAVEGLRHIASLEREH
jgi:DNA-binding transcriptional LysR family regulator